MIEAKQHQIQEIYQHVTLSIAGQICVVLTIVYFLAGNVANSHLVIWASIILTVLCLRAISAFIYKNAKHDKNPHFDVNKWIFIYQIGVFVTGILWGTVSFIFADQYQLSDLHFIMQAIIFGLAGAGIATLGSIYSIYALFVIPMASMIIVDFITSNEAAHFEAGILSILCLFFLLYTAKKHSKKSYDVIQRTNEVERSQIDLINRLGKAGEIRDNETGLHVIRMSHSSYSLALEYGFSVEDAKQLQLASTMHDIGKIGIPDSILLNPNSLTNDQRQLMQAHTTIGADLLNSSESKLLQIAAIIAGNHHEKWDGSGYPKGLAGCSIPIEARIVSICDVFDALTFQRPYKEAWSIEDALEYMRAESGKHFDANLINHFFSISDQIIEYSIKHKDIEINTECIFL